MEMSDMNVSLCVPNVSHRDPYDTQSGRVQS